MNAWDMGWCDPCRRSAFTGRAAQSRSVLLASLARRHPDDGVPIPSGGSTVSTLLTSAMTPRIFPRIWFFGRRPIAQLQGTLCGTSGPAKARARPRPLSGGVASAISGGAESCVVDRRDINDIRRSMNPADASRSRRVQVKISKRGAREGAQNNRTCRAVTHRTAPCRRRLFGKQPQVRLSGCCYDGRPSRVIARGDLGPPIVVTGSRDGRTIIEQHAVPVLLATMRPDPSPAMSATNDLVRSPGITTAMSPRCGPRCDRRTC
jgi:hypothetical protein